jgi:hypothetical protein
MEKGFRMWLFLGLALTFASTIAYAEEQYRTEISATYQRFNFKGEAGAEDGGLGVELFLAPVNTDDHPYAEAGFLKKIGSLGFFGKLHYFYIKQKPQEGTATRFTTFSSTIQGPISPLLPDWNGAGKCQICLTLIQRRVL